MSSDARDFTIRNFQVEKISIGHRLREPDQGAINRLAESIREIGLHTPITVRYSGDKVELCAGYSRLQAVKTLGWETIPCCFQDFASAEEAELWEIDENLIRGELSPAEEAAHLARRKELFLILNSGRNSPETPGRPKEFAKDTEQKTGTPKRTINQKIARANALGDDVKAVIGTSLDKGVELDALSKVQPQKRKELIEAARAGAKVSAVREVRSEIDVVTQQYNALMAAWNRAGKEARQRFLEAVDEPVMGAA